MRSSRSIYGSLLRYKKSRLSFIMELRRSDIKLPTRMLLVGGSGTGKTQLVRDMLLGDAFSVKRPGKKTLELVVASPLRASLDQPIWAELERKGWMIRRLHLKQGTAVPPASPGRHRVYIIDDLDHVGGISVETPDGLQKGKEWLQNVFGTESHHSSASVVLISHKLKFGVPAALNSSEWVCITGLPEHALRATCADLHTTDEEAAEIHQLLSDPNGLCGERLFNHAFLRGYDVFDASASIGGGRELVKKPRVMRWRRVGNPSATPTTPH